MQERRPVLPPSRAVLILLPLTLIEVLDYASNILKMHRTDVIRRSLIRDVNSMLMDEVSRTSTTSGATGAALTAKNRGLSPCPSWSSSSFWLRRNP